MESLTSSDQRFISSLREIVLKEIRSEDFSVDNLAKEAGLSRYQLYRRIKAITGQNVVRFIRDIRLDVALDLLEHDAGLASEISYRVGFGSPAYFNKCFHDRFGFTPGEARKRSAQNTPLPGLGHEDNDAMPTRARYAFGKRLSKIPRIKPGEIVLLSIGILVPLLLLLLLFGTSGRGDKKISLIVMSFTNNTNDPQYQFFADGVTESIINNLLEVANMDVISGSTSGAFSGDTVSIREIKQKGIADYILEGSVQKDETRVRLSVRLTEVQKSRIRWSDYYDREFRDIFEIQGDIARNVADKMDLILSEEEIINMDKRSPRNTEAYILYLKGRYFLNKGTVSDSEKSLNYFKEALEVDPDYALAYAGLADAFLTQSFLAWGTVDEGYKEAFEAARKAVELNDNLSEAHAAFGNLLCWYERNWTESEKELLLAITLNPRNELAHFYYSELMDMLGNDELARKHVNIALELNPFLNVANYQSILCYTHQGKYYESLKEIERVADVINDKRKYYYSYLNYLLLGEDDLFADYLSMYFSAGTIINDYSGLVSEIYAAEGKEGVLHWLVSLESAKANPRLYLLAYWHACLNDKAEAVSCLKKAYDLGTFELPHMNNDPFFWSLYSEPGFQDLIENMGLTYYFAQNKK